MAFIDYEALTVSTSALGPTAGTATARVRSAIFVVEAAAVRSRDAGTSPTATVGLPIEPGGCVVLRGESTVKNIEFIRRDGADATVHCWYFDEAEDAVLVVPNPTARALGASEVKATTRAWPNPSTTRSTVVTPTSGKKIRMVSVAIFTYHATETTYSVYFHTGANYGTDATKAIHEARLDKAIEFNSTMVWPDGGGPVGAADDVVSIITGDDIVSSARITIQYREE